MHDATGRILGIGIGFGIGIGAAGNSDSIPIPIATPTPNIPMPAFFRFSFQKIAEMIALESAFDILIHPILRRSPQDPINLILDGLTLHARCPLFPIFPGLPDADDEAFSGIVDTLIGLTGDVPRLFGRERAQCPNQSKKLGLLLFGDVTFQ